MKQFLIRLAAATLLLALGFGIGRVYQHLSAGYYYEVREEKQYSSPTGTIHWKYVTESVGVPFLDPGTTILEYDDRIIYKAQRGFQESVPFARHVSILPDDTISWDDGEIRFRLSVERIKESEQAAAHGPDSASAEPGQ